MALTFTARTSVSLVHESDPEATLLYLRRFELSDDLDVDIVIGVREGHPDQSALADGLRGRGTLVPLDPACSATEARNAALARMVERGNEYAWILSPDLAIGPSTLGILTRHMRQVPDCAVTSPRIMRFAEPRSLVWSDGGVVAADGSVRRISAGLTRAQAPKPKPADVDAGHRVGSLYRGSAFEAVGLFAEDDVVDGHDVGWSDRARRAGWRVMIQRRAKPMLAGVDE